MAVPFALGHVIDIIYTADTLTMQQNLQKVCLALTGVFLIGGIANFGRVYLMNVAGKKFGLNFVVIPLKLHRLTSL